MMTTATDALGNGSPEPAPLRNKPVLLGIVGDSAAGKTTLTNGIINIFGPDRVMTVCTDDYHRYDRQERKKLGITPLHPDCNYIEIMEQHLRLLADGEPILKPVYGHARGTLDAPELMFPKEIVVIEGLLAYHTKAMRDCFDVKVYLDPPEDLRRKWKVQRDCAKRNYEPAEVIADLEKREPDSAAWIRPQRDHADIVIRFHPPTSSLDFDPALLDVHIVLRPTLPHPYLLDVARRTQVDHYQPIRLSLARDAGKPVDVLEVEGKMPSDVSSTVEKIIWETMALDDHALDRAAIGLFQDGEKLRRSESLALTQLMLVSQLCGAKAELV